MKIEDLQKSWDEFGKVDPLWAILTASEKKGNKWDKEEFFSTGKQEIAEVIKYIQSLEINLNYKKALDFGCGVGRLTQALAEHFEEVHGVDIAPSMIELADRYNHYTNKCLYHLNERDNLQIFENESFNFIYTSITLQHMKPKYAKNYLQEFFRILAPNGVLIFQIPSELNFKQTTKKNIFFYRITRNFSFLYFLYYQLKYKTQARMEMYGIKKAEVLNLINNNGGQVLKINQDDTITNWTSFQYFCTKQ